MQIKAKDIFFLFNSFKNAEGRVLKVSIYPSDFGLERMRLEVLEGPGEIWKVGPSSDQKEPEPPAKDGPFRNESLNNVIIVKDSDPTSQIDPVKLRRYEQSRLKYYYAVIECDSCATAQHLYDQLNDQEFELSNIAIDLRFVPDSLEIPHEPIEVCNSLAGALNPKIFSNRSTGHSHVRLTWDEANLDRLSFLQGKKLTEEEIEKVDWEQYVDND